MLIHGTIRLESQLEKNKRVKYDRKNNTQKGEVNYALFNFSREMDI